MVVLYFYSFPPFFFPVVDEDLRCFLLRFIVSIIYLYNETEKGKKKTKNQCMTVTACQKEKKKKKKYKNEKEQTERKVETRENNKTNAIQLTIK